MLRNPPDVLITTPESLYLMLTSRAREFLVDAEAVIVDEIHAVARTKRGSHLALTLERLEHAWPTTGAPAHRPVGHPAAARGGRPLPRGRRARLPGRRHRRAQAARPEDPCRSRTCASPTTAARTSTPSTAAATPGPRSIWPAIYPELLELVREHRSTIVFVNARRGAERLAMRLNELAGEDGEPAQIARAHHGSLAREERLVVEDLLKSGELPCLVATSSLELGIDMGAVDLVLQVESPKSVTAGLQRIGRAGHNVGEVSKGPDLPQVPRRPARVRRGRAAHARRRHRADRGAAQPARRAGPADRGDGGHGRRLAGARAARPGPAAPTPSPSCRASCSTACSTCSTAATPPRSSPSCGRGSCGTGWRTRSARARARCSSR